MTSSQMPKHQCKNTIKNSDGNISELQPSNPTMADIGYSNRDEIQEKDLKTVYIKMIEALKEE